jgi:peptidoglycan hydrolase-like protein with peptidoglycan-binding domain
LSSHAVRLTLFRACCAALLAAALLALGTGSAQASSGDDDSPSVATIKAAQRALGVKADGIVGPKTRRAIRRFQREEGLEADGVLGPQTLRALGVLDEDAASEDDPGGASEPAASAAPPAPSGEAAATLERIAECESGGDPTAVSPDGRHRGKYQFDQETWEGLGGTGDPAKAPEAEQDARAAQLLAERGTAPWPVCGANA